MVLEAGEDDVDAVVGAGVGGEGDGGGGASLVGGELAEAADEGVAVFVGHADVADENVGSMAFDEVDRFARGGAGEYFGVAIFEETTQQAAGVGFVIDDDNFQTGDFDAGIGGGLHRRCRGMTTMDDGLRVRVNDREGKRDDES